MPPLHAPTQFSSATAASTPEDAFAPRHHGQSEDDLQAMLQAVGAESLDHLIDRTVPADIRAQGTLELRGLDAALGESAALERLRGYAKLNRPDIKSLIGQGYHGTRTPAVILRNIVENPAWYTPYTPYQAEIAQGRMEAILNFQTVVSDLTGLPLAGASLLDEATAAAEAMGMCVASTTTSPSRPRCLGCGARTTWDFRSRSTMPPPTASSAPRASSTPRPCVARSTIPPSSPERNASSR